MNINEILERGEAYFEARLRETNPPIGPLLDGQIPFVIYPAARLARSAAKELNQRGVCPVAFGDRDPKKSGEAIGDIPVLAPEELVRRYPDHAVLVASSMYDSSIRQQLGSLGYRTFYSLPYLNHCLPDVFVSREYHKSVAAPFAPGASDAIRRLYDRLADESSRRVLRDKLLYYLTQDKQLIDGIRSESPIYFDPEIWSLSALEVVADGGAYNGDTLEQFVAATQGRFRGYHAFEPDPLAIGPLRAAAEPFGDRVLCVGAGLSDRTGSLRFVASGQKDGRVADDADNEGVSVMTVDLDSYFERHEPPTFIKMDIEGSEYQALRGAKRLISSVSPTLAISCYHHPRDLWGIPTLIEELNADYSVYLRHYTHETDDTVCYAVKHKS